MILFPFAPIIAAVTSVIILTALWTAGELGGAQRFVLLAWFVAAAYAQFLGASVLTTTIGLVLQTALAVYLVLRWRTS